MLIRNIYREYCTCEGPAKIMQMVQSNLSQREREGREWGRAGEGGKEGVFTATLKQRTWQPKMSALATASTQTRDWHLVFIACRTDLDRRNSFYAQFSLKRYWRRSKPQEVEERARILCLKCSITCQSPRKLFANCWLFSPQLLTVHTVWHIFRTWCHMPRKLQAKETTGQGNCRPRKLQIHSH